MKIRRVEAIPVRLPRAREAAVGTAGSPTALEGLSGDYRWSKVFPVLYPVHFETALVKITLEDGTVGWGEAQAPLAPEVACIIVRLLLAPVVEGQDFDGNTQRLWDLMYATMRVRGQTGGFMLDAIAGVDLALWDLAGKLRGEPVWALIADAVGRKEVTAYHSGVPGETMEARVQYMREQRDRGFHTFKIFHDGGMGELLETVTALRGQCGIAVDALWRLSVEEAIGLGREMDRVGALWLEAPLAPEDPLAHAELARAIGTRVAIGESYRTRFELAPFFREGAMRIVQPDLGRCGLTESIHIARVAAERSVQVVPHVSIAMGPQIAAAIHLAAALPNCEMLEFNPNVLEIANGYLREPLRVAGGRYEVPQTPGLGCWVEMP
jgi:D-galactarolactone cycloisomerase